MRPERPSLPYFNPPSPCGEGPCPPPATCGPDTFQSTLPVWGGTFVQPHTGQGLISFQSTLPVWGGTPPVGQPVGWENYFNPPSPCGEGRKCAPLRRFQRYFNPPSPCGEGHFLRMISQFPSFISIHPPRVGRDQGLRQLWRKQCRFQSTLPVWGGTYATWFI